MNIKLLTYDTETTGNDPNRCGIRQISGLITYIDLEKKTYEHKQEFDFLVRPNFDKPNFQISEEALNVGPVKLTEEEIKNFPDLKIVQKQVVDILTKYVNKYDKNDKLFLAGYNNNKFDDILLRQWWLDAGDNYYGSLFYNNTIDNKILATNHLLGVRNSMENFKQLTVAKQLGIELDESKLHDAKYDNRICFEIYKNICGLTRHDGKTK